MIEHLGEWKGLYKKSSVCYSTLIENKLKECQKTEKESFIIRDYNFSIRVDDCLKGYMIIRVSLKDHDIVLTKL